LSDDILVTDLYEKIIYVNKALEKSTGYSRNELLGNNPAFLNNINDITEKIGEEIFECVSQGEKWSGEMRQRTRSGNEILAEFDIFPVLDENKTIAWASIKRDITERKRMEETLRQSEKKYRQLFNNTNDAIFVHEIGESGLPGRYIEVNTGACRLLGYTRDEFLNMSPQDVALKGTGEEDKTILNKILRKSHITFERLLLSKDGSHIPVEISPHLFMLDDKQLVLSIVRDISERKQIEELLQIKSAAMEASIDGMAILNSNEEYIYTNESHLKIYGYDNEDKLIGKTWKVLYNEDEIKRIKQEVFPVLLEVGKWKGGTIGRKRDGSTFYQEVSLSLLNDGGMVCVVRDTTHRI